MDKIKTDIKAYKKIIKKYGFFSSIAQKMLDKKGLFYLACGGHHQYPKSFLKNIKDISITIGSMANKTPFMKKKLVMKTNPCVLLVDDLDNPKNNKKAVGLIKMFIKKVKPIVIDLAKSDK